MESLNFFFLYFIIRFKIKNCLALFLNYLFRLINNNNNKNRD